MDHTLSPHSRVARLAGALLAGLALAALLLGASQAQARHPAAPTPARPVLSLPPAQAAPRSCPLDVAIVFDKSGSMEYDPVCLGCWERTETAASHANDDPHYFGYYDYPENGVAYPLLYTDPLIQAAIASSPPAANTYRTFGSYKYMILEGELYSGNTSIVDTAHRAGGKGYWTIQRGVRDYPNGSQATNATMGMYVGHHPDITFHSSGVKLGDFYTLGGATSGNAPQLSYDFSFHPDAGWGSGAKYVWVRVWATGEIGTGGPRDDNGVVNRNTVYWQIQALTAGTATAVTQNNSARTTQWTWVRLGSVSDASHQYRLNIWAGSSGYGLDRIVITDNPSSTGDGADGNALGNARTADLTAGSAHLAAADPCNPVYGNTIGPGTAYPTCSFFTTPVSPTNTLDPAINPMWGDEEAPLRSAKEATKLFIERLDPSYDQVGLVGFNDAVIKASQLECLQRYGRAACVEGSNPISFTNVLRVVEDLEASGSTNIASGMKAGLEILGLAPYNDGGANGSYGRGGAAKVMILLTDGTPYPEGTAHPGGACAASDWYPDASHPDRVDIRYNGQNGYDCVLWFAEYAREHGVALYTVGLGFAVDPELLKQAAERGNGLYFFSATGLDLEYVYDAIVAHSGAACTGSAVEIAPSHAGWGLPGQTLTYTHQVTNAHMLVSPDFTLSAVSDRWASGWTPATLTLFPGETAPMTVSLVIPSGALSGTVDLLAVTVTSQLSPTTVFDTVTDTTTVGYLPGAHLARHRRDSQPRLETLVYTLTNTGNYTETFHLTATTQLGWPVALAPSQLTLGAGRPALVTASVTLPGTGVTDTLTLAAYRLEGGVPVLMAELTDVLPPSQLDLSVSKSGAGTGVVSSSPAGIDCGGDCSHLYDYGTVVTLTATADIGSAFAGWSGACSGSSPTCRVTMNGPKSVTATFTLNSYSLSVSRAGTGNGLVSSQPPGIACGADCTELFDYGTIVTVTATASAGLTFTGWGGACSGAGVCQLTMDAAKHVTATFTLNSDTLSVSRIGSGAGSVSSLPPGIACGADCVQSYLYGTVVTLTAAADPGSTFTGWSGACSGSSPACQVAMTEARNVTAAFALNRYLLSVSKSGAGSGTVSSQSPGIACGADCSQFYDYGTVVTLTATAAPGSTFMGWGGACSGIGVCTVTMDAAKDVTAAFTLSTYALRVDKSGAGAGLVSSSPAGINCGGDCAEIYDYGTGVTLTATASTGSTFVGWSGACSGAGACTVTMDAAKSVTAAFTLNTYVLSVDKSGAGSGVVSSNPSGINCGPDCSETYDYGTVVTLTAAPANGSSFVGWSGACSGTDTCTVTMDAAKSVTAAFALNTYALTVDKSGTGSGTVGSQPPGIACGADCAESYPYGSVVTLTAVTDTGSAFSGWSDACQGLGDCVVTMDVAKHVTATFNLDGGSPGSHYVYLPLVSRQVPPDRFPASIGRAIPVRPVKHQGEVFFRQSVQMPGALPASGRFYFSSQPDVVAKALVDDELAVLLEGEQVFAFDFSTSGRPKPAVVEVPRSIVQAWAGQTLLIEYRDVYAQVVEASEIWLIWVP